MPDRIDPHEIPPHIRDAIVAEIGAIEHEHNVRVLWAIESGSRAWGFPSPDSDFDARFIYIRERDWYLSIAPGRDVIERPVDKVFDVSGWDLRKALNLLRGGNATLSEWLDSPIVYRSEPGFHDAFVALIDRAHRQDRSYWHYRSVAENYEAAATSGGSVRLKKWLYALRTCLAAEWAATRGTKPPMRLTDLADGIAIDPVIRSQIDHLIAVKAGLAESSSATVEPELAAWLAARVAALSDLAVEPVAPVTCASGVESSGLNEWATSRAHTRLRWRRTASSGTKYQTCRVRHRPSSGRGNLPPSRWCRFDVQPGPRAATG